MAVFTQEEVDAHPEWVVLENNTVKDTRTGHFLGSLGRTTTSITSDNARALARRRWQVHREAAAEEVARQVAESTRKPSAVDPAAAWALLNADMAKKVLISGIPRPEALQQLGKNIGAVPSAFDLQDGGDSGASSRVRDAAILVLLEKLTGQDREDRDIIEGSTVE